MIGNAAFFVSDDHLHAFAQDGLLKHVLPRFAVGGIRAHHVHALPDHRVDDTVNVLLVGVLANNVHIHGWRRLVAGHCRGGVIENDVRDVLALLERVGDTKHSAMEKRRVTEEDHLFVGDKRINARARAAAQAHAAVVVHEILGRLKHQHRIAARITMKNQVYRAALVVLFHVAWINELLLHLDQHAGTVAMRAAGAERRGAQGNTDIKLVRLVNQFDGAVDTLLVNDQIRVVKEPPQGCEPFDENARIQTPCRRDSDQPGRELLTPNVRTVGSSAVLVETVDDFRDLLFHEPAALFDDKDAADLPREFCDQLGIDRITDTEFEDRHLVRNTEFRQRVFEVTKPETRGYKTDLGAPTRVLTSIDDPGHTNTPGDLK